MRCPRGSKAGAKAEVGLADFAASIAVLAASPNDTGQRRRIATLLGIQAPPPSVADARFRPVGDRPEPSTDGTDERVETLKKDRSWYPARFGMPIRPSEHDDGGITVTTLPEMDLDEPWKAGDRPPPLIPLSRLRSLIRDAAVVDTQDGAPDVDQLVEILAAGQPIGKLPRLRRPTLRRRAQVVLDLSSRHVPFRDDFLRLVVSAKDVLGRETEVWRCRGVPGGGQDIGPARHKAKYTLPPPGFPVLVIGGLPAGESDDDNDWERFGQLARTAGCPVHVLSPLRHGRGRHPGADQVVALVQPRPRAAGIGDAITAPSLAESVLAALWRQDPDAYRLAVLASLATRVEPRLLRRLRLDLLPGVGPAAEAALWVSPLVNGRTPELFEFHDAAQTALCRELGRHAEALDRAWELTCDSHRDNTPDLMRLEEELRYRSLRNQPEDRDWIGTELSRLQALTQGRSDHRGLAAWSVRVMTTTAGRLEGDPRATAIADIGLQALGRSREAVPRKQVVLGWCGKAMDVLAARTLAGATPRPRHAQVIDIPAAESALTVETSDGRPLGRLDLSDAYWDGVAVPRGEVRLRAAASGDVVAAIESAGPPAVYIVNARADEAVADQLRKRLNPAVASGIMQMLDVRDIQPGSVWSAEIRRFLEEAAIFVVLLSPEMLASSVANGLELARAMERVADGRARILPIEIAPCPWQQSPLGKFQALVATGTAGEFHLDIAADMLLKACLGGDLSSVVRFGGAPQYQLPYHSMWRAEGLGEALDRGHAVVLVGPRRTGKTSAAWLHAQEELAHLPVHFFVCCHSEERIVADLAQLAKAVGAVPIESANDDAAHAVLGWLVDNPGWLLVYDDADDEEAIRPWLPLGGGKVIIASTNADWAIAETVAISPVPAGGPAELDSVVAATLMRELDGDRDAIAIAAALVAKGQELGSLLSELRLRSSSLAPSRDKTFRRPAKADIVVALALVHLRTESADSALVLRFLSIFAETALPSALIKTLSSQLGVLSSAIDILQTYHLVEVTSGQLSLPPSVRTAVSEQGMDNEHREWGGIAIQALALAANDASEAAVLAPHALAVAQWWDKAGTDVGGNLITALMAIASHVKAKHPPTALALLGEAEHVRRKAAAGPPLAKILNEIGAVALAIGDDSRAEAAFLEAIDIADRDNEPSLQAKLLGLNAKIEAARASGRHKPSIALEMDQMQSLKGLSYLARRRGDFVAAAGLIDRALQLVRCVGDPLTEADLLAVGAGVAIDRHDFQHAHALLDTALNLVASANDQVRTLRLMTMLATLDHREGQLEQARSRAHDALALASELADIATEAANWSLLGRIAEELADFKEAIGCFRRAVDLTRYVDAEDAQATALLDLGQILARQGLIEDALETLKNAANIARKIGAKELLSAALSAVSRLTDGNTPASA